MSSHPLTRLYDNSNVSAPLHPALTDFGPRSLERYFRQMYPEFDFFKRCPLSAHQESLRTQPRPGFQREFDRTKAEGSRLKRDADEEGSSETFFLQESPTKRSRHHFTNDTSNRSSTQIESSQQEFSEEAQAEPRRLNTSFHPDPHNVSPAPASLTKQEPSQPISSPTHVSTRIPRESFDFKSYFEQVTLKQTCYSIPRITLGDTGDSTNTSNNISGLFDIHQRSDREYRCSFDEFLSACQRLSRSHDACLDANHGQDKEAQEAQRRRDIDTMTYARRYKLDRTRFPNFSPQPLSFAHHSPPYYPNTNTTSSMHRLSTDVLRDIARYLSFEDVKNLRLVNRQISQQLSEVLFRSVVVPFNHELFNLPEPIASDAQSIGRDALIARNSTSVVKFGITFEVDEHDLTHVPTKTYLEEVRAWWGTHPWPKSEYPRFEEVKQLEELADNPTLLSSTMSHLTNTTELGLSIDSGHGWLNGADLSDHACYESKFCKSPVFGRSFPAEDLWHRHGWGQIFRAGQQKTVDFALAQAHVRGSLRDFFLGDHIHTLDTFGQAFENLHHDDHQHTGGSDSDGRLQTHLALHNTLEQRRSMYEQPSMYTEALLAKFDQVRRPHYPLIFGGYNIAGVLDDRVAPILDSVTHPRDYPLKPGRLSQAQAEWLMETVWAQKALISSYVTSVIRNKHVLRQVHSLHIGKLSSGLLHTLEHSEFWSALPNLQTITILVIPDWRRVHVSWDGAVPNVKPIAPMKASIKLMRVLDQYIAPLENITNLKIGFIGGGEHARGILARNQHILPAPLTSRPKEWLNHGLHRPEASTILVLNHIKKLTLVNCWVSPAMLTTFMSLAQDTSLKHLILDSVSMTASHGSLPTFLPPGNGIMGCRFPPTQWMSEIVPNIPKSLVWTRVINTITPGLTLNDHLKSTNGSIHNTTTSLDPHHPAHRPNSPFRGHIQKITFKSCGYVTISGLDVNDFNQNDLVKPVCDPMDPGLKKRAAHLKEFSIPPKDNHNRDHYLLGTMTQCVHPIEERVLTRAFDMKFGWGGDLARWDAVEDGCFRGGTGRFSGEVVKTLEQ